MTPTRYITVVPSIRTIPGVEEFDYAYQEKDLLPGDLILVPFRKQMIPALVVRFSMTSLFADKVKTLEQPIILLRLGEAGVQLVEQTARHTFSSKPSVLNAWIRTVPKKAQKAKAHEPSPSNSLSSERENIPAGIEVRTLLDRYGGEEGLLTEVKKQKGRCLIVTPWQHRADALAAELGCKALHANVTDTEAWEAITTFSSAEDALLVTTRLGGWLTCVTDAVFLDEPENDDFKQDELSPRFDVRWIISLCHQLRPTLSVFAFSTTPRLLAPSRQTQSAPFIDADLVVDPWRSGGRSAIDHLSTFTVQAMEDAQAEQVAIFVLHSVGGERSRIACRDCGWSAECPSCHFILSQGKYGAVCRKCGRKATLPETCPTCGGTDLTKGRLGIDRLQALCRRELPGATISIMTPFQFDALAVPKKSLIILTDLSLLGAGEDIRRKERQVIAFRRIAACASLSESRLIVQGPPESVDPCHTWLTADGVHDLWKKEYEDRALFGYPPAAKLVKLLVSGTEEKATNLMEMLTAKLPSGWRISGPLAVPYRAQTRTPRFVLHLHAPLETSEDELIRFLAPQAGKAIIDLDPIAFFS
jgi:primosomal protein N'